MKKIILVVLTLALLFALAPVANAQAADVPAGGITITATEIDYVSAIAGIAKPESKTHSENERFAVLVTINIPSWYSVENMSVVIEREGLTIDEGTAIPLASGNYIVLGTLYSANGKMKITLRDDAINYASTAQELWAALYGDRSVYTVVSFAAAAQPAAGVYTAPVLEPPQTGDKPATLYAVAAFAAAAIMCAVAVRRQKRTN